MIPDSLSPIANHLWQSTVFAGGAGLLTLALRHNSARVRHWVWVTASLKFLVPFSPLMALGSRIEWRTAAEPTVTRVSVALDQLTQPFTGSADPMPLVSVGSAGTDVLPAILWTVWACGCLGFSVSLCVRWLRIRAAVRAGSPVNCLLPIRVVSSPTYLEPGVFGVFRPVLLLPEGIFTHLTPDQLRAIVAHELCHVRHRDNLVALLHMCIETTFWFHPVVWWIGRRIVHEREKACDEEVMRLGNAPDTYAQGILKVCELYLESPLACVPGISGPNLRRRIADIMTNRRALRLNHTRRLVLVTAGLAAIVLPVGVGIIAAPRLRAQSNATPTFEVASIKRIDAALCDPPLQGTIAPGRLNYCGELTYFIQISYDLYTKGRGLNPGVVPVRRTPDIEGAPEWLRSERYQIEATAPGAPSYAVMAGPMLQALLEDRLKLKAHRETRNVPVYELRATNAGPKLQRSDHSCVPFDPIVRAREAAAPDQPRSTFCGRTNVGTGTIDFLDMTLSDFAQYLGHNLVDRPVINTLETAGRFNFRLQFPPNEVGAVWNARANSDGRAMSLVLVALQEQLGLRLERATGPQEVLVIDSVERPSEN